MHTITVPLNRLRLSPNNVRKTVSGIDDLAASIAAHGLLQNLTVTPHGDEGIHEVVAGGRRLRALQLLVEREALTPDYFVPCTLVGNQDAGEVSTAENVVRQAMHPADEFDAFHALAQRGLPSHLIAERFGCDDIHVRQRLRLASVAPAIMADYRAGNATLEQLMALTVSDDHDAQQRAWKSNARDPRTLRELLTTKKYDLERHPVARFVGAPAYTKAGGRIDQDLFGGEGAGFMVDTELADKLAMEKLQRRADQLVKEGWLWAEPRLSFSHEEARTYQREHAGWVGGKYQFTADVKAFAGVVVSLDRHSGKFDLTEGLVRPGDKPKAQGGKAKASPEAKKKAAAKEAAGGLPFAHVQRLQGVRTAVLRLHLMHHPRAALAALAADLYRAILADESDHGDHGHYGPYGINATRVIQIAPIRDFNARPDKPVAESIDSHPATAELDERIEQLRARIPTEQHDNLFAWLLTQDMQLSIDILTACTAVNVVAAQRVNGAPDHGLPFAQAMCFDFTDHWKADAEWLASVPRAVVLRAVEEVRGPAERARIEPLRGEPLITTAAELLADTGWLPPTLRSGTAAPAIATKNQAKTPPRPATTEAPIKAASPAKPTQATKATKAKAAPRKPARKAAKPAAKKATTPARKPAKKAARTTTVAKKRA